MAKGSLLLAGVALCACVSASALAAAGHARSARSAFLVSIEGYQRTVISRETAHTDDLGCTTRTSDLDRQTLSFTTPEARRIVVSGTRLPMVRIPVQVTIAGTKHRQTTIVPRICGSSDPPTDATCGPARAPAQVVVTSRQPGTVHVAGGLLRERDRSRCATLLDRAYPFLEGSDSGLNIRYLPDPTVQQINVYGDTRLVDRPGSGVTKTTTIRWTLVYKRVT